MADEIQTPTTVTRLQRWRDRTDGPLLVLAIGSLPLLLLELKRHELTTGDRTFLDVVNIVVFAAFTVDYVVEVALALDRRAHIRSEWTSAVIVAAQALALAPALAGFGAFRALRAARFTRTVLVLARVFAIGGAASREGRGLLRRHAVRFALGLAGFTWVSSAVAFMFAEDVGRARRVESFGDALWWSASTITTVGYGDVYPVTGVGRGVAVVTMVVGMTTFAVVTAKLAELLVRNP